MQRLNKRLLFLLATMLTGISHANTQTPAQTPEVKQLEAAAQSGDAQAQFELGALYANGDGVTQSDEKAYKSFDAAAKQGHQGAQLSLAFMYANGSYVKKDLAQSYVWGQVVTLNGMDGTVVTDVIKMQAETAHLSDADFERLDKIAKQCIETSYKECAANKN